MKTFSGFVELVIDELRGVFVELPDEGVSFLWTRFMKTFSVSSSW